MREYHGFQPWYLGGDEYYTYEEVKALLDDYHKRAEDQRKEAAKARQRTPRSGRR